MSIQVGQMWLIVSGLLFGFYCLNVAIGKIALVAELEPIFSLGDVGEFAVLFAAVISLVIVMLERESQQINSKN